MPSVWCEHNFCLVPPTPPPSLKEQLAQKCNTRHQGRCKLFVNRKRGFILWNEDLEN